MSAKEMFEKLGYEVEPYYQKDHCIMYAKHEDDDFFGTRAVCDITFYKRTKVIDISGFIKAEDLQAINKQVEELGWLCYETKK